MKMKTQHTKAYGMVLQQCLEENFQLYAYIEQGKRSQINNQIFYFISLGKGQQINLKKAKGTK